MIKEFNTLVQILIALVFGSYGYTFLCSQKNIKRDEFKDVKDKIDKIYDLLIEKALDKKEDKEKEEKEKWQ
jgi:hypothetical protein